MIFYITLCSLFSLLMAWAPATHPAPSKLPKALEFAEKAWRFPKNSPDETAPFAQTVSHDRTFPWSPTATVNDEDQSLSSMEGGEEEQFYFDGHTSVSLRWPTRQAFLDSLHKPAFHMTVDNVVQEQEQEEEEDCEEHYYDDTGDVLCWATMGAAMASSAQPEPVMMEEEEEECEHTYFDRIGGDELCWATFLDVAQTVDIAKQLTSHPGNGREHMDEEDCEETCYDDTGDLLCWAI
ncbi:expressed unknown protein [Seminavis robusta]|uniref:Uncharacterized protein n=1 Tax=Seminavis robusta TaxID=568900 RepID=A0A9N8EJI8_9STRA|nr:expressed unknown protein [Seminavis robusta]|eukprot:Sro1034_g233800.1 n/a (237) ;mRNA; r:8694-9404